MTSDQQETNHGERNNTNTIKAITGVGNKRSIKQIRREIGDLNSKVSSRVPGYISTGTRSHVIQVTTHGAIMGGRNE